MLGLLRRGAAAAAVGRPRGGAWGGAGACSGGEGLHGAGQRYGGHGTWGQGAGGQRAGRGQAWVVADVLRGAQVTAAVDGVLKKGREDIAPTCTD